MNGYQENLINLQSRLDELKTDLTDQKLAKSVLLDIKKIYQEYTRIKYQKLKDSRAFSYSRNQKEKFRPLSASMAIAEILLRKINILSQAHAISLYWRHSSKGDPSAFIRLGNWRVIDSFEKQWIINGSFEKHLLPFFDRNSIPANQLFRCQEMENLNIKYPFWIYRFRINDTDTGFILILKVARKTTEIISKNRQVIEKISEIISMYIEYFNKNESIENIFKDAFIGISEKILNVINTNIKTGKKVTIALFQFHSFDRYFSTMGENFSRELIEGISEFFKKQLKKMDLLYILSPEEYLLVAEDCSKQQILKKFPQQSLSIKGMVINFRSKFICIEEPIQTKEVLWNKLFY